jgi:corrinoid protein of di/trimethylamine methyltransferase
VEISLKERITSAVIEFKDEEIVSLIRQALDAGINPKEIVFECLIPGLDEVGRLYSEGEYFLPELVMCGDTVKEAMKILDPLFKSIKDYKRPGFVVIGTVKGDMHDIGKNMVAVMLKGAGYDIFDMGVNVSVDDFLNAIRDKKPDILALSALLLTTREEMRNVIDALEEFDLRNKVKVIVGGCPVDQEFADDIGADGYGEDALEAVRVAHRLIGYEKIDRGRDQ